MGALINLLGIMLIAVGIFGLSYTWHIDNRTAEDLSSYCDIEFQTSFYADGKLEGAVLSLWDYRFDNALLMPKAVLYTDGKAWEMKASVKQTPPSYDFSDRDNRRILRYENKLFVELPRFSLPIIREAKEVRLRFYYNDGRTIDLPLSKKDLNYWQQELLD